MFSRQGEISGIATGYDEFDKMTDGLHGGEMIVIAARPSMGKTSLAMGMVEHIAIELGLPVGVFSLEMSAESLSLRMMCSLGRVNLRNIRDGFMAQSDFPKLMQAAARMKAAPIHLDDTAGLSILQLRARARRMHQQHGIRAFVIDYLQLMNSTTRKAQESRQQEISEISSGVKALAKELKVPVIVLSQLNREIEKDKSRKPRLSDLRESGSIEQDADLVGMLYKPEGDEDQNAAAAAVPVNFLIAKQRNGPTGDVHLTFLKPYTRFENAAMISDDDVPANH
jgi:replicative DNA helicase